jgi:hypothetical protein
VNDGRFHLFFPAVLACALLQALLLAGSARAEYAGMTYYMSRPKLALDLSYRFDSEERTGPYINTKNATHILNERFDIETDGFIYHPALLLYTLRLSPEWEQTLDQPDPGSERTSDNFMLGYAAEVTLLEAKPYTVNLFARKQRSLLTSSLATTSETESETYGASLNLKYKVLPTILSYTHIDLDQTGFYDYQETRDEARLNMRHNRPSNDTYLYGTWLKVDRNSLGSSIQTDNMFGTLQNLYRVTADNRVLLNSVLNVRQFESDEYSSSGYSLSETLNWQHTRRFSTNYTLMHTRDESDGLSLDRTFASAGLSHSLYENLVTTATVSGSTGSDGDSDFGGNVNFNYQRSIPWGMIYANIGQDYRVNKRAEGNTVVDVFFEPATLTTGGTETLDNRNVYLDTIVVTSQDGGTVYTLDQDYTLEVIGTTVRISRTTFGFITEGQTVSVNYSYLSDPAYDSSTYGQSYGLGFYLWSAWRTYYRYTDSKETFIEGIPPDELNDETRHALESDLTWKWSTTRFLYEDIDSTSGISLTRLRLDETLSFRPLDNTYFSLSGYLGQTIFKETDAEENFYGARLDFQWQVNSWTKARVEGFYGEVDGTTVRTVDKGLSARLDWFYGIWTGGITYRYLNQEDLQIDQTLNRHSIYMSIRRSLY